MMPNRSLILLKLSLIVCGLMAHSGLCLSEPTTSSVTQTQTKLKEINDKIDLLRRTLASANDRRGALNKELAGTEKQIGDGIHKLRSIQESVRLKETKIAELQDKVNQLNSQLQTQQKLLADHVRARYQMGEYQPLKWVLDQNDPYKLNRLLTYYQYIIKSRQQLIMHIAQTRKNLTKHQEQLHTELAANQQLQQQVTEDQKQLEHHKNYHTALIDSLNNEIQTQQNSLDDFEKDKNNLSRLLNSLAQKSAAQNSVPFINMRKKLPPPIQTKQKTLEKMNQGLTFFADEGTVVTAVYPGKVVFSDWLKGYGLLLIIDHGEGFMTLYAHNQSLFKLKGQTVSQNEQIASVGHSGGIKQNGLYFEIRQQGKAISPLDWLAKA